MLFDPNELNKEGAYLSQKKDELKKAEKTDLITLPGGRAIRFKKQSIMWLSPSENVCYVSHVLRFL